MSAEQFLIRTPDPNAPIIEIFGDRDGGKVSLLRIERDGSVVGEVADATEAASIFFNQLVYLLELNGYVK